jgi:ribonuclease BN (tRNA processing enzyme)
VDGPRPEPPRLRLLGTGNAFHDDGRGSQALYVEPAAGEAFAVDLGPTAACQMQRFEVPATGLDRVFFTHLHGDHVAGWPFLLLELVLRARRERSLEVWGPPGTTATLQGLGRLCYGELLEPPRRAFEVIYRELAVAEVRDLPCGTMRVDVLPMEHDPTSIGFRFKASGRVLAVTGDTRWCPNLARLAEGADLLVCECSTLEPGPAPHVSLEELRREIDRLRCRRTVLVHLTDEVAAALAADPLPRVIAGYDGMELDLARP